jgi:hypothetical protein
MPAVSQAQRGYLAHKFGPEWMKKHHFDNKGKLPEHKGALDKVSAVRNTSKRAQMEAKAAKGLKAAFPKDY